MMLSPDAFTDHLQDAPYLELIRKRDQLIQAICSFEKDELAGDRSDPAWNTCPMPDVKYQMNLEYLAALCTLMREKYNEEYVSGERTLQQDAEEA